VDDVVEVAAGNQLLQLQRGVPPGGTDPTNLLLTQFSMLGYQIVANQYFQGSNLGIPVGPVSTGGGSGSRETAACQPLSANTAGGWTYDVTLAYAGRLTGASATSSPYLGVGSLLQVGPRWYDYYGNTIASDLSTPGTERLRAAESIAGCCSATPDALVGLGQWPSANASWQVGGAAGAPQLTLNFSFDTTRYASKTERSTPRPTGHCMQR